MYLITSTQSESGTLETLPQTEGLRVTTVDALKESGGMFKDEDFVVISTESVIDKVIEHMPSKSKRRAIMLLKDKAQFRAAVAKLYPDFVYEEMDIDQLKNLKLKQKMVVKPQKGFFGTAVRILEPNTDMNLVAEEIQQELQKNGALFSETILSKGQLLLEDYIEGEEYAVDMYYDENGEAKILNIYKHPEPLHPEYLHMLYYSSKTVFDQVYQPILDFFTKLNEILQVKNFTIHGEFKQGGDLKVRPIEMNPLRLGGVGLGNMLYYAMNINPYAYMLQGQSPGWSSLWNQQEHEDAFYTYIIAYNGKRADTSKMRPNIERLKSVFTEVLNETALDYKKQLTFATFTLKETEEHIPVLLSIDFDDYFEYD